MGERPVATEPVDPTDPAVEPVATRPAVSRAPSSSYRARALVWFCAGVVCAAIAIRFLLKMFGAEPAAAFTAFIYNVTDPLVLPFRGIFGGAAAGRYVFDPASIVAFAVYLLLAWGLVTLIRILAPRRRIVA